VGRLFGSSGIRGPYPSRVDAELGLRLGSAAATLAPRILLGRDARLSSPLLAEAFAAGALAAGARVDDAGEAATPSVAVAGRDYDAAVVVTASHNPAPDNGFKFWNPDGSAWLPDQEDRLEGALDAPPGRARWDAIAGRGRRDDVAERHIAAILATRPGLSGKLILDCGSGSGCHVSPSLFMGAGLNVEVLHGVADGRFPHRPSEPSPENLQALRQRCRAEAEWGLAHDGDADRVVAVDPGGNVVPSERVLVALALLLGARRIATPVDASLALARALPEVQWDYTRVGDAHVSAAVRTHGADLGAETSGTYIVPRVSYAPDGPLAGFLFLHAAREGLVDEAARRLGPVHRWSEKVPLGDRDPAHVRRKLAEVSLADGERAARVDGLRVDTNEGWFLVRPSGTEPILRLTAEGADPATLGRLRERARDVARDVLR
jgi:phosphoglucosamine mutase